MLLDNTSVIFFRQTTQHRKSGQMKITLIGFFVVDVVAFNIRKCGQTNCVKNCYCIGCCYWCCCCCYCCCCCCCSISMNKMWSNELCQELLLGLKIWSSSLFFETPTSLKLEFVFGKNQSGVATHCLWRHSPHCNAF